MKTLTRVAAGAGAGAAAPAGCRALYSEEERALLALTEAVKEMYVRHVDVFVSNGKQLMARGLGERRG